MLKDLERRVPGKRPSQRDELEQNQAERALVASRIKVVVPAFGLFRRHVQRCADDGAESRLVGVAEQYAVFGPGRLRARAGEEAADP